MNKKTYEALETMEKRLHQIEEELQNLDILSNVKKLRELNKERSNLSAIVSKFLDFKKCQQDLSDAKKSLFIEKDSELLNLLKMEIESNEISIFRLSKEIEEMLIPKDENDDKNVIVEIRGAVGGDEANIFAGDLFKMYKLYCEKIGWKITVLESSPSEAGGYSQIIFLIKGDFVYSKLKFESGAHRVQRVPKTDTKGRIQTSTATVAVLPEMDEVEVEIKNTDLRIDTYRSSGAGGQHVNTTDSAVRITHIPTGIVASSQDGRSQFDNKDIAMKMLRAKIYEEEKTKQQASASAVRKNAVGTGARSEKIRTYNYPQNRVTDHRIGLTLNKLDQVMEGLIDDFIIALINEEQRQKVAEQLLKNEDN